MTKSAILDELNVSIVDKVKDEEYVNKLKKTKDKVKYLRLVKNYTQMETASLIGISERQVQRIEKKLKSK
ncbi:RNA polymerase subunit sigma [Clostridium botulinum]|uniref:RNA polymerase subunit sigma n=1 Tax=Clostridium botulinum TaxID=1491 RepID=UPI001401B6B5|nr:RNA polymerase subunit sigma [Clostridium botulinum]MBY6836931.1 RNA polymerase subunit sigma [Clostridium botulinum]NFG59766.1 RNA polymerase subunit sigma [Clostridium botulinum]NFG64894.1 RNA polymerase subunit sigma [Clostridium botulinum]NFQ23557.1 RNA polymerase subunit sigma [Clostridium botulinum]